VTAPPDPVAIEQPTATKSSPEEPAKPPAQALMKLPLWRRRRGSPKPEEKTDNYAFETYRSPWGRLFHNPHGTVRTREAAAPDVAAFATRLGIALEGPIGILRDDIERFVINHNLNIDWYQRKLAKEAFKRAVYFVVSLGLLLIIPIGIAFMPGLVTKGVAVMGVETATAEKLASAPTLVTAQISAVLTGFFAFHRALSAYFDKRELVGIWSRTLATLKQQLYAFEQTWETRYIDIENREEFSEALREVTGKARDIVLDEQRQYYENLSYPNLDLGAMIKSAASDSAAVLAPAVAAAKSGADRETELSRVAAQLDARIVTLTGLVSMQTAQLQKAETSAQELEIRTALARSRADLRAAEMDRAVVARAQGGAR
jgi:hypothetical protein